MVGLAYNEMLLPGVAHNVVPVEIDSIGVHPVVAVVDTVGVQHGHYQKLEVTP